MPMPTLSSMLGRAPNQDVARLSGRSAEPGTTALAARRPQEGSREFLNFLTWPFFLAQLLAANELLAKGMAGPGAEALPEPEREPDGAGRAAPEGDPANLAGLLNGEDGELIAAEPGPGRTIEDWFAELDEPREVSFGDTPDLLADAPEAGRPTSFGGGGGSGGSGQSGQQSLVAADTAGSSPKPGCDDMSTAPDQDLPPVVQSPLPPPFDGVAGPIVGPGGLLDTVGDAVVAVTPPIVGTTTEVIEGVLGPVGTTLDAVGGIVTAVAHPIAPVLDGAGEIASGVLEPVAGLVQSAGAVVESLLDVAQPVVAAGDPVLDLANDLVADTIRDIPPVVQPVTAMLTETVASVTEVIDTSSLVGPVADTLSAPSGTADVAEALAPIVTPVVIVLEDALPLGDHQDDLSSGGTLSFADPPSPPATDALFAAGKYTDYGIALSGMPAEPNVLVATPDQSAQSEPPDAAAEDAAPALSDTTSVLLASAQPVPSLAEEIGLRSSDGLL